MSKQNSKRARSPKKSSASSRINALTWLTSTRLSTLPQLILQISAAALLLASTGLGAVYAYTTGSQHGVVLAALLVLFAVGLELCKPFAVSAVFTALRSWSLVRGAALALMATMCILYSFTAQLTLMAGARGDTVAVRASVVEQNTNRRILARSLQRELSSLAPSRPASAIEARIEGLLQTPGSERCETINGPVTKRICPRVASLREELAIANRRATLQTSIAKLETELGRGEQVRAADPGSAALSTYLAALGFNVRVAMLTEWLALVPVLALEIGSALAVVLVHAVSGTANCRPITAVNRQPLDQTVAHTANPTNTGVTSNRQQVKEQLLDHLAQGGGELENSERGLAALIGTSRPTVRRALHGLVAAGLVAAEATRNGTALRLVA